MTSPCGSGGGGGVDEQPCNNTSANESGADARRMRTNNVEFDMVNSDNKNKCGRAAINTVLSAVYFALKGITRFFKRATCPLPCFFRGAACPFHGLKGLHATAHKAVNADAAAQG